MIRSSRIALAAAVFLAGAGLVMAYDPQVGDFTKERPGDVRLVAWNVERNFIDDSSKDAAFARVMTALQPDVIVMPETVATDQELIDRFDSLFPLGNGQHWQVHTGIDGGNIRNAVVSRWPMSLKRTDTAPLSSTRGVTMALVDVPDSMAPVDIYVMGVHLKCCYGESEEASRQRSADAIIHWMGDATTTGGNIDLPAGTPMIVLGDFNLVGGPQGYPSEVTLHTSDIADEATFGPDIKPDWDSTDLFDVTPADPYTGDTDTWQSGRTNPSSRLDRFFITDSVLTIANTCVFNTYTMNSSQRTAAGVNSTDTSPGATADHLPILIDFRFTSDEALVAFDAESYACSDIATVTLTDSDIAGAGSIDLSASVDGGASTSVHLTETASAGVFTGSFTVGDGSFPVANGDTIRVAYEENTGGGTVTREDTALIDCAAPVVSNLRVESIETRSITIAFDTDEPAFVARRLGPACESLSTGPYSSTPTTTHQIQYTSLEPNTAYSMAVLLRDGLGNTIGAPVDSCLSATTLTEYQILINEVDPNNPSRVELFNPGPDPVSIAGFKLRSWQWDLAPESTYTFPAGTTIAGGGYLTIIERSGTAAPNTLYTSFFIDWFAWLPGAVELEDVSGNTVDFVEWNGMSLAAEAGTTFGNTILYASPSYSVARRVGVADTNLPADWMVGARTFGAINEPQPPTTGIYEYFDGATNGFDLSNTMITFTPDAEAEAGYTYTVERIDALPESTVGTAVEMGGEDWQTYYRFASEWYFVVWGDRVRELLVGSDGFVGIDDGRSESSGADVFSFLGMRRVAGLDADLDPTASDASIQIGQFADRAVVSYNNIPRVGTNERNNFQIILYQDGRIKIAYGAMASSAGFVGISKDGASNPTPPPSVDFTAALSHEPTAWMLY